MPQNLVQQTFKTAKPIIAMVHFPPLPGAPHFDTDRGVDGIVEYAAADIARLQQGGVDAIMFGNEGDRPYQLQAPAEGLAAMSAAIGMLKSQLKVPFGVNYLWDPVATVALGVATGAVFAREIFTGVYESDMGLWQPDAAGALRLRHHLGRNDMTLMYNINAEFASPLGNRGIEARAKSAVFSSLADIVLVSGPMTGQPAAASDLRSVREAVEVPVFANTGVNIDNVEDTLSIADGVVIGTHFKVDGDTWNAVDGDRVRRFMERVGKTREKS